MCRGLSNDLPAVLQKGGLASTVISFAQKTYANGVLTSKLHVIELGAQAGIHKRMRPDRHPEAAMSKVTAACAFAGRCVSLPSSSSLSFEISPWQLQHCSCPQPAPLAPWHLLVRALMPAL